MKEVPREEVPVHHLGRGCSGADDGTAGERDGVRSPLVDSPVVHLLKRGDDIALWVGLALVAAVLCFALAEMG